MTTWNVTRPVPVDGTALRGRVGHLRLITTDGRVLRDIPLVEEWLSIPDLPGYEASTLGRIRSLDRTIVDSRGHSKTYAGKVIASIPNLKRSGYHYVSLSVEGRKICRRVPVLVMRTFVGPAAPGQVVRHRVPDVDDNRLTNLRYGSHADNARDTVEHGRNHNQNKTVCPRQHLLIDPNLRASIKKRGARGCLACSRALAYAQRHAAPGEKAVLDTVVADRYYVAIMVETAVAA